MFRCSLWLSCRTKRILFTTTWMLMFYCR